MLPVTTENIKYAAKIIKAGGIVAFPTETVYGLGGSAVDSSAIDKIYRIKERPRNNPLILHCDSLEMVSKYVELNDYAISLAQRFWPGPLTLVLQKLPGIFHQDSIYYHASTLAVRIPAHVTALTLIEHAGIPIAAPSANKSGRISPTSAIDVFNDLANTELDLILDGGRCSYGLESTVLDLSNNVPVILRPGVITAEDIENFIGNQIRYLKEKPINLKSPGLLDKHYAPSIPVRLNATDLKDGEGLLAFGSQPLKFTTAECQNLSQNGDLNEAAANLYHMLRILDKPTNSGIAVMPIPSEGIGVAINDRLARAASTF
jgi:L-threonylcarbamoyladenylate synthase